MFETLFTAALHGTLQQKEQNNKQSASLCLCEEWAAGLSDSCVTPVTAMLAGRGLRGAATGRARTFTPELTLFTLC
jgi:hypothetical protein